MLQPADRQRIVISLGDEGGQVGAPVEITLQRQNPLFPRYALGQFTVELDSVVGA